MLKKNKIIYYKYKLNYNKKILKIQPDPKGKKKEKKKERGNKIKPKIPYPPSLPHLDGEEKESNIGF